MTQNKQPLWSRSVAAALASSIGASIGGSSTDPERVIDKARQWRERGDLRAATAELRRLLSEDSTGSVHESRYGLPSAIGAGGDWRLCEPARFPSVAGGTSRHAFGQGPLPDETGASGDADIPQGAGRLSQDAWHDHAPGDPAARETAARETTAGKPAAGDPAAGDTAAGETTARETTAGKPAAGDPAAGDTASGHMRAYDTASGDITPGVITPCDAVPAHTESCPTESCHMQSRHTESPHTKSCDTEYCDSESCDTESCHTGSCDTEACRTEACDTAYRHTESCGTESRHTGSAETRYDDTTHPPCPGSDAAAHAVAHVLLAELLIDQSDPAAAVAELQRALALGAELGSATVLLGRCWLMQSQYGTLLAELHPAGTAAQRAAVLGLRAQALLGLRLPGEVRETAMQALQLQAECPQALLAMARLATLEQQPVDARACLQRALATSPHDADCLRFHADLLRASGSEHKAAAVHQAILERQPGNAQALLDLALLHGAGGRFDQARSCISQARKVAGAIAAVLHAEALLYYEQDDLAQAGQLAERLLRASPRHGPALLLSGAIKLAAGLYHTAEQQLQQFLRRHPGHRQGSVLLAQVHLALQHPQAALVLLGPLLAAPAADPELLETGAIATLRTREYSAAAALFARASMASVPAPHDGPALALSRMGADDDRRQLAELEAMMRRRRGSGTGGIVQAMAHLRARRHDAAFTVLSQLAQADDTPLVQTLLGEVHLQRKDARRARHSFCRSLEFDPAYLPALDQLRQLDQAEHKPPEQTRNRYLAALAAAPASSTIMESLSSLALEHQHPQEAIAWLERARAEHPASLPLALGMGGLYLQLGMSAQAAALAQSLFGARPDDPDVLALLGRARLAAGEHDGAGHAFAELARLQPQAGTPLMLMASVHLARHDDAAALAALQKALLLEPALFAVRQALVELLLRHRRGSEALTVAAAAQRLDSADARGHALEGAVHSAQGQHGLACQAWDRAFALAPSGSLLVQLHAGLMRCGQQDEADARITAWLDAHPDDVTTRLHLASSQLARYQLAAASVELETILAQVPDHLDALNNLAWICQRRSDPRALHLAQRAHALAPDNPAVMDTLGFILLEQGELSRALPLLQKAATLAPDAGEIHFHLGSALARQGDKRAARRALEKALLSTAPFSRRAEARHLLSSL